MQIACCRSIELGLYFFHYCAGWVVDVDDDVVEDVEVGGLAVGMLTISRYMLG
jgi:hypothetical protein